MEFTFDRILGILGVIGIFVGLGVAIAMDPKSRGEMNFSVACFVFSGVALSLTIGIWAFKTDVPYVPRILLSAFLFAGVTVAMVEASRWANGRFEKPKKAAEAGTDSKPGEPALPTSSEPHESEKGNSGVPKKGATKPAPTRLAPSQPPQTIIQVAPTFGNLKERAIALSQEIMDDLYSHGWEEGDPRRPPHSVIEHIQKLEGQQQVEWCKRRSRFFRARFLERVLGIRDEFAQLHIHDDRLDRFRENTQIDTTIDPLTIQDVAERLVVLADQIKQL